MITDALYMSMQESVMLCYVMILLYGLSELIQFGPAEICPWLITINPTGPVREYPNFALHSHIQ